MLSIFSGLPEIDLSFLLIILFFLVVVVRDYPGFSPLLGADFSPAKSRVFAKCSDSKVRE